MKYRIIFFIVFCTAFVIAGCSDDGSLVVIAPSEPAILAKPVAGLLLFCNGEVAATVDSNTVTGIICAKKDQYSSFFEVEFLDEIGNIINDDFQQHKLAWDCDSQCAKFESAADWKFCIFGKKCGNTTFQLMLKIGEMVDYCSPEIPLQIQ